MSSRPHGGPPPDAGAEAGRAVEGRPDDGPVRAPPGAFRRPSRFPTASAPLYSSAVISCGRGGRVTAVGFRAPLGSELESLAPLLEACPSRGLAALAHSFRLAPHPTCAGLSMPRPRNAPVGIATIYIPERAAESKPTRPCPPGCQAAHLGAAAAANLRQIFLSVADGTRGPLLIHHTAHRIKRVMREGGPRPFREGLGRAERERRQVGPEAGPTPVFSRCIPTGMQRANSHLLGRPHTLCSRRRQGLPRPRGLLGRDDLAQGPPPGARAHALALALRSRPLQC